MTCPVFPKPVRNKASLLKIFFGKRHSLLDGLYERSYRMKMGEVRLPSLSIYMVNQPNLVRKIMVENVNEFPKHRVLGEILEPLLGESIFTTNGNQWKKQRDMLDPSFELAKVDNVLALMQAAADDMSARMAKIDLAQPYDIDAEMTYVTADIIFRTIMSTPLDPETANRIFTAFARYQQESPKLTMIKLFNISKYFYRKNGSRARELAAKEIRTTLENIIRPRYETFKNGTAEQENPDILSSLLQAIDEETGEMFSFTEIVDQVSMLFLAGHETSATALTWSLYLLSLHPEIQAAAFEEVSKTLGGERPSVKSLKKMQLVHNIFREALRLYPPVGFFMRQCAHATKMRDKDMKAGSSVIVAPWLIHRHHDFWQDPNGFDPYRFDSGKQKVPLGDSYMPFGMGPRVCIGAAFAKQEAVLILATILANYQLEMAPGFEPVLVGRLTLRSENGMHLMLKRRKK